MEFVPQLDNLVPYIAGTPIEEVLERYGIEEAVKLASNESPLPPFPEVLSVIEEKFRDLNRYPDSSCRELREALGERYRFTPDRIVIGNGSCELLIWISLILLDQNAEAVISDPTFLVYEKATVARGATPVKVPLKSFANDLDSMLASLTRRTRIVFLTNPHNPTGAYLPAKDIREFAASLPQQCLLVLDEAYNEYVDQDDSQEGLDLCRQQNNVFLLRTFSKIYGLCGLRVGYGICAPEVREAIDKVRQPFNVNMLAQAAALKALSLEERLAERRTVNLAGRRQLYDGLTRAGISYVETQSNFMLVDVEGFSLPADDVPEALMKLGVIVRPGKPLSCPGYVRVSIGTEEENSLFLRKLVSLKKG